MLDLIKVSVSEQSLQAIDTNGETVLYYKISTAKNGLGQVSGSECTPLGSHRIRAKIGDAAALGSVFVGRRQTGEVYSAELAKQFPQRDWILTRILWLCGNESGFNRGGQVDTQRRYIYIHGAPDSHRLGVPSSHGCVKMRNNEMLQLFDLSHVGLAVNIVK